MEDEVCTNYRSMVCGDEAHARGRLNLPYSSPKSNPGPEGPKDMLVNHCVDSMKADLFWHWLLVWLYRLIRLLHWEI